MSVTCGTDAHICYDIGKFGKVLEILDEVQMPEELVLSTSLKRAEDFVNTREAAKKAAISVSGRW